MPATTRKLILLITSVGCWLSSCVEPFNIGLVQKKEILTVEATLNNLPQRQFFRILTSINNNYHAYTIPEEGLKAEVLVNGTTRILLSENTPGTYYFPESFRPQPGHSYQLLFQKPDGTPYESTVEVMPDNPEITRVHDVFLPEGITSREGKRQPGHYLYIDVKDPAQTQNNYVWNWQHFERQYICATCADGRYNLGAESGCVRFEPFIGYTFDYACNGNCWDIFHNDQPDIMSDVFFNGNTLTDKLIAKIPYYSTEGCLIEISQLSVSKKAFQYIKILQDLTLTNGTLIDPPPVAIIGNIRNLKDPEERIAGFFMATSIRKVNYWLDRKNATAPPIPFGLVGHRIQYEPISVVPPRPPLALCLAGRNRTPVQPVGWRFE